MEELDYRVKILVRILIVLIGILIVLGIVLLANRIYKSFVGEKTREVVEETKETEETEYTLEDFESYEEYIDYKLMDEDSIIGDEGILATNNASLPEVINHIRNTHKGILANTSHYGFDGLDYKEFNRWDVGLNLSPVFLHDYNSVYIDSMLTVVGVFDKNLVIFEYNYPITKELLAVDLYKDYNYLGSLYQVGDEKISLAFSSKDCEYEEYNGYKILYIKG